MSSILETYCPSQKQRIWYPILLLPCHTHLSHPHGEGLEKYVPSTIWGNVLVLYLSHTRKKGEDIYGRLFSLFVTKPNFVNVPIHIFLFLFLFHPFVFF